jgi:hypothetical protein
MSDLQDLIAQLSEPDRVLARFDLDSVGLMAIEEVTNDDGSKSCVRAAPERMKFVDGRYEVDGQNCPCSQSRQVLGFEPG